MATKKKTSLHDQLQRVFADADVAREYLEARRWKGEPYCPHCGNVGAYKLEAKADSKTPVRPGVYKCDACRKQFTVTVGTVFEGSKIPLNKWLHAMHLMCASKKGVSAKQLERMLGVTYKTAWFLCHRIRKAMERPEGPAPKFTGIVEADETYVGGKTRGKGSGNFKGDKMVVFTLIDRDGEARSFHLPSNKAKLIRPLIHANVEGSARIMTDQSHIYHGLKKHFAEHSHVDHSRKEYVRGIVHTNFAESFFSLLKRGILGTFHHVSEQHMDRYLAEFDFRWSTRESSDLERLFAAIKGSEGKRLMYKQSQEQAA